jgi:hypothetical protein
MGAFHSVQFYGTCRDTMLLTYVFGSQTTSTLWSSIIAALRAALYFYGTHVDQDYFCYENKKSFSVNSRS